MSRQHPLTQRSGSGLNYSAAWSAAQTGTVLHPGPKTILFNLQSELVGADATPRITADRDLSRTASYRFVSFAWLAQLDLVQPDATTTDNATLQLTGTTADGWVVMATCEYAGGQVVTPALGSPPKPTTCTLPASFARVVSVAWEVVRASPTSAAAVVVVNHLKYVRHNYC